MNRTSAQRLPEAEPIRFLALGDSYTIGERVKEDHRWPEQLVSALMLKGFTCHKPEIVAMTGWRTDELINALRRRKFRKPYNLVSLLIGVNNQYQGRDLNTYKGEFEELLTNAIAYTGGNAEQVFVLSIPDYGFTPFGEPNQSRISSDIDAFNRVNKDISLKFGVLYVDITDISRKGFIDPELVADDGLHPSGKMYALWVERIVAALLK